jgi:hypothetical protein
LPEHLHRIAYFVQFEGDLAGIARALRFVRAAAAGQQKNADHQEDESVRRRGHAAA